MPIYLVQSTQPLELDVDAQFPEAHFLWDNAVLVDSEQTQSKVFHAFKRALPPDTPLFIAILDHQPKFKGGEPGLLKWLRERYDSMP